MYIVTSTFPLINSQKLHSDIYCNFLTLAFEVWGKTVNLIEQK